MILYLDTSDLFKIYVAEDDSPRTDLNISIADRLASSTLTYAEMRAALARAFRGQRLTRAGEPITEALYRQLAGDFESDWRDYVKVSLSQRLIRAAGNLAEQHSLSGGDAIQLAAALRLRDLTIDEVRFSVADTNLRTAAIAEGFVVV